MSIQEHPRMILLRKKQSREAADLYGQFLRLHPQLDGYVDHDDWTAAEDAEYRELAAKLLERHRAEQRTLVEQLGGKLSPLSRFELDEMACLPGPGRRI